MHVHMCTCAQNKRLTSVSSSVRHPTFVTGVGGGGWEGWGEGGAEPGACKVGRPSCLHLPSNKTAGHNA